MKEIPHRGRVYFLLLLGVFACSTAVVWIRLSETSPLLLSGWRLVLSALLLSPLAWKAWSAASPEQKKHALWGTLLPGLALALHFISWAAGARMIEAARATLIVNMVPVAMPFVLWLMEREHVNRGELTGTIIALAGVVMLTLPRMQVGSALEMGDLVCFGSMICIALYMGLGRRNRDRGSIWLYLVPVYAWAALFCLVAAVFYQGNLLPAADQWLLLLALAVIPTIVGHGLLNYGLRNLGGQQVSVSNQGQFIFSAVMGYFIFAEVPHLWFYPAAVLIVLGACVTAKSMPS